MVERTFKDMLPSQNLESSDFPSPESLKRKILISTKLPKKYLETQGINDENETNEIEAAEEDLCVNNRNEVCNGLRPGELHHGFHLYY